MNCYFSLLKSITYLILVLYCWWNMSLFDLCCRGCLWGVWRKQSKLPFQRYYYNKKNSPFISLRLIIVLLQELVVMDCVMVLKHVSIVCLIENHAVRTLIFYYCNFICWFIYSIDSCENNCNGRGSCDNGVCLCTSTWIGPSCQTRIHFKSFYYYYQTNNYICSIGAYCLHCYWN